MTAPALRSTALGPDTLEARLTREQSTLRARSMAAVVLAVIGVIALALVASAWLMADGRWMTLPRAVPIAMWVGALAAAAGLVWLLRKRNADVLSLTSLAAAIEREQALRSGSLRGALEVSGAGALGARASQDVARRLAPGALAPQVSQRLGRAVTVAGVAAAVTVGALSWSARRAPDGFAATVHPVRAWSPPPSTSCTARAAGTRCVPCASAWGRALRWCLSGFDSVLAIIYIAGGSSRDCGKAVFQ